MRASKKTVLAVIAVLLAIVVAAGVVVWTTPVFKVSDIAVSGNKAVSHEDITKATGITPGDNLVRVDVEDAAGKVAELPWVSTATVSRSFPSTLRVNVGEHAPVAFFKDGDETRLIDANGEAFAVGKPPEGAVEITGETGNPKDSAVHTPEMEEAVSVIAALPDDLRSRVRTLEIEERYSLRFTLDDGRTVYWGADEDNADKARAMKAALQLEEQSFNVSNPELIGAK